MPLPHLSSVIHRSHTHEPTIHDYTRSADVVAGRTRQEYNRAGQIHRQTPSLRWHPAHDIVVEVFVLRIGGILLRHGRFEISGMNTVAWSTLSLLSGTEAGNRPLLTLDSLLSPLIRHGLCYLQHAALGRCVRRDILAANESYNR